MTDATESLRVEPRDRLNATAQTLLISDFEGDVMVTRPLLGQHLASVSIPRVFLLAMTTTFGAGIGIMLAASVVVAAVRL